MQYDRVQALVEQFQEDKYVLRAYGKIYALNRCKAYRSVRVEDVERRRRASGRGEERPANRSGEEHPANRSGEEHPAKGGGEQDANRSGEPPANESAKHAANRSAKHPASGKCAAPQLEGLTRIVDETLRHYTNETLNQFCENDEELARVYSQIDQCSSLCQEVDLVLTNHKNEITCISRDINEIQTLTETMNQKLHNRKVTLELLNTYIRIILVTPQLICAICKGNINEQFIENVKVLTKKLENCKHCSFDAYPSIRSSHVELLKLKNKAIDRIHRFFLNSINDIQCKRSNVHFVQQHLGRFHELNGFLYNNCKEIYTHLVKEYVAIMNRTYYNLFRSYLQDLEKKKVVFNGEMTVGGWAGAHEDCAGGCSDPHSGSSSWQVNWQANRANLANRANWQTNRSNWQANRANLASPPGEAGDSLVPGIHANLSLLSAKNKMMNMLGFGSRGGAASQDRKESLFPLNGRAGVLLDLAYHPGGGTLSREAFSGEAPTGEPPIGEPPASKLPTAEPLTAATPPVIFPADDRPHFFEAIYKSVSKLFLDTGTAEYLFLCNFFRNYESHEFLFLYVYSKTLSLHFDFLHVYLSDTFDVISLFCIYMINMHNGCLAKRRGIAPLYEFIHRVQSLVWNRIDYIVGENVKSLATPLEVGRHTPANPPQQKNHLYHFFHLNSAQAGSPSSECASPEGVFTTSAATHLGSTDQGEPDEEAIIRNASLQYGSSYEGVTHTNRHPQSDGTPPHGHTHPVVKRFADFYCSLVVLTKLSLHFEKQHHVRMCCGVVSPNEKGSPQGKKTPPSTTVGAPPGEELPHKEEDPISADRDSGKRPNSSDPSGGDLQNVKQNVKHTIKEKRRSDKADSQVGLTDGGENPPQGNRAKDAQHNMEGSPQTAQHTKGDQPVEEKYSHLKDLIGRLEESIIDVLAVHKNQFAHTREQLLFLINNYCHVIDVMKRNTIEEEKIERFEALLKKEINAYVEHQLNHYATDLILFVCTHEQMVDKLKKDGQHPSDFTSEIDAKLMESVAVQFTTKWKNLFKNIKQEVTLSFSHTDTSAQILKMLNTQILLYFTRFHQLLKGFFARAQPPPCVQNLPSVDVVLVQIKRDAKGGDS
ncbi:vacuolar protein sorting-associated protein 52, putative [Plasmodium vivax]|uniref:Vacuolar protein sorting-associated protein 52, putative n=1 Tax=Plasmodium vivax TaxID=5855 RepID=A0A564ZYS4_PLAVI|nr:vacuolar protein sorting-associated protein 52, putative [Plasmodium vivax]